MIFLIYILLVAYSLVQNLVSSKLTGNKLVDTCKALSCFVLALTWPTVLLANTMLVIPALWESFAYYYMPEPLDQEDIERESTISQLEDLLKEEPTDGSD